MYFRVLGPIEVVDGDVALKTGSARLRTLLALLLINAGDVVSVGEIIEALWGGAPPGRPEQAVQMAVSRLRHALEVDVGKGSPHPIQTVDGGYQLDLGAGQLDAVLFENTIAAAVELAETDPASALALAQEAVGLWRGAPYADATYEPFAQMEIHRLDQLMLVALDTTISTQLTLGRHREIIGDLETLIDAYPTHEPFWGYLAVALYRSGRQADAVRAFQRARITLDAELGIRIGPQLLRLEDEVLRQDPALDLRGPDPGYEVSPPATGAALPHPVSSFVGRSAELASLARAFEASRLVTITGPGGIGKTRLAVEFGHQSQTEYRNGVLLLTLDHLEPGDDVAQEMVAALELACGAGEEVETLQTFFRPKSCLLIVDGCDAVVAATGELADAVLTAAPEARILVTSRQALGLDEETVLPIPPLGLPVADAPPDDALPESVELFVSRAQEVMSDFQATPDVLTSVNRLVTGLDGIPLAIELAAHSVHVLDIDSILQRVLTQVPSARKLDPTLRQLTIRTSIQWSYDLLDDLDRAVFERISVFEHYLTAGGACAVCPDVPPAEIARSLDRLVARSLLARVDDHGSAAQGTFFTMLRSIRDFARSRLDARPDPDLVRRDHARHLRDFMETMLSHVATPLESDHIECSFAVTPDVMTAFAWAEANEAETALRIAAAMGVAALRAGVRPASVELLNRALDAYRTPDRYRARALTTKALLAHPLAEIDWRNTRFDHPLLTSRARSGRLEEFAAENASAAELALEAWQISIKSGAPATMAYALMARSWVDARRGRYPEALTLVNDAIELLGDDDHDWLRGMAHILIANISIPLGDLEGARDAAEEAGARLSATGDLHMHIYAVETLARIARASGNWEQAITLFDRALALLKPKPWHRAGVGGIKREIAFLHLLAGDRDSAWRLHREAMAIARAIGDRAGEGLSENAAAILERNDARLEHALEHHRRGVEIFRDLGDGSGMAMCLTSAGLTYDWFGRGDLSLRMYRDALQVRAPIIEPHALAACLLQIATRTAPRSLGTAVRLWAAGNRQAQLAGIDPGGARFSGVQSDNIDLVRAAHSADMASFLDEGRSMTAEDAREAALDALRDLGLP